MEGDVYCSHCGAHFKRSKNDDDVAASDAFLRRYVSYNSHTSDAEEEFFLDYGEVSETYIGVGERKLEHIAEGVCATESQKIQLKAQIRQYQKVKDFTGFYIKKDYEFEVYYFHFIQENEYVKTTHVMTYIRAHDCYRPYRTFYEEYSRHSHDKLLADPRFKKLVEGTALEFDGCAGGYKARQKEICADVTLTGEIEIRVHFRVDGKIRVYYLDLDEMKLYPDYYEYDV